MVDNKPKLVAEPPKAEVVAEQHVEKKLEPKAEVVEAKEAEPFKTTEEKEAEVAKGKLNSEVMAAQAKCRPTPTPEEVRLALEGKNPDAKADHGAPEQFVHPKAVYETRASVAKKDN